MSTALQQILEALKARIDRPQWAVEIERATRIGRSECPLVNLKRRTALNPSRPARPFDALHEVAQIDVEIYWFREELGVLSGDAIDAQVHAAVFGEQTLGGLARAIFRAATDWDFSDGDALPSRITVRYEVHHATKAGDITVRV